MCTPNEKAAVLAAFRNAMVSFFIVINLYITLRSESGNRMFENKLLLPFAFKQYGEIIEAFDLPSDLEAVQ